MLEKCLVGRYVTKQKQKDGPMTKSKSLPLRLKFDFRQPNSKSLTLNIYTSCATLATDHIFVHIENSKQILVLVYIDGYIHTIAIGKSNKILTSSQSYFIDLDLLELVITNDFIGKRK